MINVVILKSNVTDGYCSLYQPFVGHRNFAALTLSREFDRNDHKLVEFTAIESCDTLR